MSRRSSLAVPIPSIRRPAPLFVTDYDRIGVTDNASAVWQSEQEPSNPGPTGTVQTSRLRIIAPADVPGAPDDPYRPRGHVLRAEIQPFGASGGDVTTTDGYQASRAEVYDRQATPSTRPAAQWPDPPGAVRYFSFNSYLPPDFTLGLPPNDPTFTGILLSQWKQLGTGSPPMSFDIRDHNWSMYGTYDLGAVILGSWHRWVFGFRYATDTTGWMEAYRDGVQVLPRKFQPTMRLDVDGVTPLPNYFKQGIYRSTAWTVPHVAYFGPVKIGSSLYDVT